MSPWAALPAWIQTDVSLPWLGTSQPFLPEGSASTVPMSPTIMEGKGLLQILIYFFFHMPLNFQKAKLSEMELTFLLSLGEERGTWSARQKNTLQRTRQ